MRLTQAGKYTAAARSRLAPWGMRAGAGAGIAPLQVGISSSPSSLRPAPVSARSRPSPPPAPAPRAARAERSTVAQRRAASSATRSARGPCSAARSSLTSAPVSIPTGHARLQVPSAAHVSRASYSYCSSSAVSTGEPSGWRAISRRSAIRWRGVVVRSRLGQTGSQKPHSMHWVATASISGVDFRLRRWAPGSRFSSTPRPRIPSGSARPLTRHIISVAFAPHSRST